MNSKHLSLCLKTLVFTTIFLSSCSSPNVVYVTGPKKYQAPSSFDKSTNTYTTEDRDNLFRKIREKDLETAASKVSPRGKSAEDIAKILEKSTRNEAEKAYIAFRWISLNIAYDTDAFFAGKYFDVDTKITLSRGKAVCGGFARLYSTMSKTMGLEVFEVSGFARGYGELPSTEFQANHAWNAVNIDGRWYIMDATWGSGNIDSQSKGFDRQFKPFYFAPHPRQFVFSHYPDEADYQFLPSPLSKEDFVNQPKYGPRFFANTLRPMKPYTMVQKSEGVYTVEFSTPNGISTMMKAESEKSKERYNALVTHNGDITEYRIHFPKRGRYEVTLFTENGDKYSSAANWYVDIEGRVAKPLPKMFTVYEKKNVQLKGPLIGQLNRKEDYDFELVAPGALKVAAVLGEKWFHFEKDGNRFSKTLPGNSYTLYVQYDEKKSFTGLIEYF